MRILFLLIIFSSCSLVNQEDAERLTGAWQTTEKNILGNVTNTIDHSLAFKADSSFDYLISTNTVPNPLVTGSYKTGYYPPRQVISLFDNRGNFMYKLFFYFDKQEALVTSVHSNFEQAKTWKRI